MQKFVTSITTEFGEPVVASTGATDAGKIVALDETGKIDKSVLPIQSIIPAGVVQYFARQTAPEGWLIADGGAVSRIEFTDLFEAVGTVFGAGDGSTTFNLPDLRGEFIRGWVNEREGITGESGTRNFGSWQADQFQGVGIANMWTRPTNANLSEKPDGLWAYFKHTAYSGGNIGPETYGDAGYGNPRYGYETRPRNLALLACIKY